MVTVKETIDSEIQSHAFKNVTMAGAMITAWAVWIQMRALNAQRPVVLDVSTVQPVNALKTIAIAKSIAH